LTLKRDEEIEHPVSAVELAAALGIDTAALTGMQFLAVLRETLEDGQILSGFWQVPGAPRRRRPG
jgi:hypothetical protein